MKFKEFMKKHWMPVTLSLFAFLAIAKAGVFVDRGTNVDNLVIDGTGIYDSSGVLRWTPGSTNAIVGNQTITGSVTVSSHVAVTSGSDFYLGSQYTQVSTATTALSGSGVAYTALLGAATAATEGMALCSTTPVNGVTVGVCGATSNLATFVGIAAYAASTGSIIGVQDRGWILALTTGTVTTGSLLQTSSLSAGSLETTTFSTNNVVGLSLSAGITTGGLNRVKLR